MQTFGCDIHLCARTMNLNRLLKLIRMNIYKRQTVCLAMRDNRLSYQRLSASAVPPSLRAS